MTKFIISLFAASMMAAPAAMACMPSITKQSIYTVRVPGAGLLEITTSGRESAQVVMNISAEKQKDLDVEVVDKENGQAQEGESKVVSVASRRIKDGVATVTFNIIGSGEATLTLKTKLRSISQDVKATIPMYQTKCR